MSFSLLLIYSLKLAIFAGMAYNLYRCIQWIPNYLGDADDDEEGGLPKEPPLPRFDPPTGGTLDDLLTDRLPPEFQPSTAPAPRQPVEA